MHAQVAHMTQARPTRDHHQKGPMGSHFRPDVPEAFDTPLERSRVSWRRELFSLDADPNPNGRKAIAYQCGTPLKAYGSTSAKIGLTIVHVLHSMISTTRPFSRAQSRETQK